jgi:hypothetical protein
MMKVGLKKSWDGLRIKGRNVIPTHLGLTSREAILNSAIVLY